MQQPCANPHGGWAPNCHNPRPVKDVLRSQELATMPPASVRERPVHHEYTACMKPDNLMPFRRFSVRQLMWAGLALVGGALLMAPYVWPLPQTTAVQLSVAAALVGYLGRRRLTDAIALALPPLAGPWVDGDLGSHALLVACLVPYLLTWRPQFAAVAGSTLVALLLTCIGLKERFAGTTLTWQDFRFFFLQFTDNVDVMASQPTLLAYAGVALCIAGLVCVLAWRWKPAGRPLSAGGRPPRLSCWPRCSSCTAAASSGSRPRS